MNVGPRGAATAWPRWAATAAIILILAAMTAVSAGPAAAKARPLSQCTATTGAIVAVDFGHWGGPVLRSCGTTPTTGYALLNQGGWLTTGTEHDGPGFICRIGYSGFRQGAQYPTPSQQACVQTPPASAYWASWQAAPGQDSWTYSQYGAMSYHPEPGSVSLWVFGATNLAGTAGSAVPTISPDGLRAPPAARAAQVGSQAIVDAPPVATGATGGHGSAWPTVAAVVIALLLVLSGIAAVARRRRLGRS
jgi:hypothetical protein